jgi:formylglycine-generating enzyme required for sulfatase activity
MVAVMGYIFISYSHKDKDYVHKLKEALQSEGFEVWMDDRIDYGEEWPMVIQERLDTCDAFILVATEDSYMSKWVQKEVTRAQRINKPFFPLLLSGHPWLSIESTQYVLVKDKSLPPGKFYERLARVTSRIRTFPPSSLADQESVLKKQEHKSNRVSKTTNIIIIAILIMIPIFLCYSLFPKIISLGTNPGGAEKTQVAELSDVASQTAETMQSDTQTVSLTNTSPVTIHPTLPPTQEILDSKNIPMVFVSAGQFTMGSNLATSEAIHQVHLDSFYIDKFEVTNEFYAQCVQFGPCQEPKEIYSKTHPSYYGNPDFANYPVVHIDWFIAKTYCQWRGGRLPTEAEWEKAARGTDERTYPWGNEIDCEHANFAECVGDTMPVESYKNGVSPYGAFNMAGNVWEWVSDWFSPTYYDISPLENPLGPENTNKKTLRGGSWVTNGNGVRISYRYGSEPSRTGRYTDFGLRCARTP